METPKEILHEIDNANNYYLEDREMLVVPLETIKQYFESIPAEPEVGVMLAEVLSLSEYYNSQEIQDWMNAPMGKPGVGQVDTIVIKPCPFCGKVPKEYTIGRANHNELRNMVKCETGSCALWGHPFYLDKWNERVL